MASWSVVCCGVMIDGFARVSVVLLLNEKNYRGFKYVGEFGIFLFFNKRNLNHVTSYN